MLFPALEAVGFCCQEITIKIFHLGCPDTWIVRSSANKTKNTAYAVVLGRRLNDFSSCLPKLLSFLSNGHIPQTVRSGPTLPRDEVSCPISRDFLGKDCELPRLL